MRLPWKNREKKVSYITFLDHFFNPNRSLDFNLTHFGLMTDLGLLIFYSSTKQPDNKTTEQLNK